MPVVRHADGTLGFGDGGDQKAIDWVLRMARVPAGDFLDAIATEGGSDAGRCSMRWATRSPRSIVAWRRRPGSMRWRQCVALSRGMPRSARDAGLAEDAVQAWQTRIVGALDGIAPWLARRERDGFVRRAHGDLHLGNLCLWQGRPVPFDALEFDEAMATIDLGYDLAFLLMDLDRRVSRAAANRVLSRYVARTGDAALTGGLPVFLSLRAMVRAHVEAKRGAATSLRDIWRPPRLIFRRSARSCWRSAVCPAAASPLWRARWRRTLATHPARWCCAATRSASASTASAPEERLPQSAYSDAASEAVFAALAALVRETASGGHAVIADATFIDPRHRTVIEAAARAAGVPFLGLWLEAPLAELEARIAARRRDASDATIAVLRAASRSNPRAGDWVAIDATEMAVALTQARDAVRAVMT